MLSDDNEDCTKLKAIVKENVKAILSENRILISISFATVIQTLKADPQMVKLIHNIPTVNDGEQNKDNNNGITKYLEANKHRLLNLTEKNYENLVEVLTDNAIVAASSNPTLSLPSSTSMSSGQYNQNNIFRIEKTETFHNSKGDIAD